MIASKLDVGAFRFWFAFSISGPTGRAVILTLIPYRFLMVASLSCTPFSSPSAATRMLIVVPAYCSNPEPEARPAAASIPPIADAPKPSAAARLMKSSRVSRPVTIPSMASIVAASSWCSKLSVTPGLLRSLACARGVRGDVTTAGVGGQPPAASLAHRAAHALEHVVERRQDLAFERGRVRDRRILRGDPERRGARVDDLDLDPVAGELPGGLESEMRRRAGRDDRRVTTFALHVGDADGHQVL